MKPNFALYFSSDSVTLLHRTSSGWMQVGSVAFDEPDLDAAMTYLRGSALGLEPRGVFTKLVIPNSEILYTSVDLTTLGPGRRRAQIGRALDGLTPYALEDLAYDWSGTGAVVQVAAIARETLAEAEAFAVTHRFNPVSFVASPEPGSFAAEPWFGPTAAAAGLLPQGERVERDQDPVRLAARSGRTEPAVAVDPVRDDTAGAGQTDADTAIVDEVAEESGADVAEQHPVSGDHQAEPAALPPAPAGPEPEPEPERLVVTPGPEAEPLPEAVRQFAASLTASVIERAKTSTPVLPELDADKGPDAGPPADPVAFAAVLPEMTVDIADTLADLPADAGAAAPAPDDEAPFVTVESLDAGPEPMPAKPLRGFPPVLERMPMTVAPAMPEPSPGADDLPAGVPDSDAEAALARALTAPDAGLAPDTPSRVPPVLGFDPKAPLPEVPRASVLRADLSATDDSLPPPFTVRRAPLNAGDRGPSGDAPAVPGADRARRTEQAAGAGAAVTATTITAGAAAGGARALRQMKQAVTARSGKPGKAGKGSKTNPPPALPPRVAGAMAKVVGAEATLDPKTPDPSLTPPRNEAEAMTVFGARRDPVGGKPRYLGLMLTAVLLAILAAVAVWAAFFLDPAPQSSDATGGAEVAAAVSPGQIAALPGLATPSAPDAAPTAPGAEPAAGAEAAAAPPAPVTAGADPAPQTDTADLPPADGTADRQTAQQQAPAAAPDTGVNDGTDVAARAPGMDAVDEIFLALGDQDLRLAPPPGQPRRPGDNQDAPPAAASVLPPFGALYQFDADGNIVPTREGVVTPDGVRLVAGRPPRVPPQRPATADPAPAVVTAAPAADPAATGTFAATGAAPADTAAAAPLAVVPGVAVVAGAASGPVILAAPDAPSAATPPETALPAPDPRLAGARPRARPAGLVPEVPATAPTPAPDQQGALASDTALANGLSASPRPRERSATVTASVAAATAQAQAAAAAAAAASTAAIATASPAASRQAVAISRKPAARPRNFDTTVVAAVAASAPRTAPAASARTRAPAAEPDVPEDEEPEVTRAAPSIPTRASVAKQATLARAINLNRMNLIGVYGTANSRYALVRTSSGRYQRVKVGDRLDGGQVSAITQTELRYTKGGQSVKLSMPNG